MTKNTTMTLEQFINLFNTDDENEFWDICYLDDSDGFPKINFRPEVTIE